MIYHIATLEDWRLHLDQPAYFPKGYLKGGFIHCSTHSQVPGVLQRYYAGVNGMILLHIDEAKLLAALKYEASANQELFPHVFRPINKDAIVLAENL